MDKYIFLIVSVWMAFGGFGNTKVIEQREIDLLKNKISDEQDTVLTGLFEKEKTMDDLVYRPIPDDMITLNQGQQIFLVCSDEKEYNNITICKVSKDKIIKKGILQLNTEQIFTVEETGNYVILSDDRNITKQVDIVYCYNDEQEKISVD